MLLTNQGKRGLRRRQQERQIIMPEIPIETIVSRNIQQPIDLGQDLSGQNGLIIVSGLKFLADSGQMEQDTVFIDFAVNDQFSSQTIHFILLDSVKL